MNAAPPTSCQHFPLFEQLTALLRTLSAEDYRHSCPLLRCGSAGGHVRHSIEFYQCFLDQLATGRINYDARPRNIEIETDPAAAVSALRGISRRFGETPDSFPAAHPLQIREGDADWLDSTCGRELRFLFSHTVHHMALIAFVLRSRGLEVPEDFGVAPSTLKHRRSQVASTIPASASCAR